MRLFEFVIKTIYIRKPSIQQANSKTGESAMNQFSETVLSDRIFPYALLVLAAASAAAGYFLCSAKEHQLHDLERIPRSRLWGTALGALALYWCSVHAKPLVSDGIAQYLVYLAILCTWLGFMFLDFVLARSFGGLLILAAHYFLYESFALKAPLGPLFASLCLIMGTFGIVICGKPYYLRDIIRKTVLAKEWKYGTCTVLSVYAVSGTFYGLWALFCR